MHGSNVKNELSPEESDVAMVLEYYSQPFTIKTLAKAVTLTEEHVREILNNLGLLDVVSKKRIEERRRIGSLAQEAYRGLARAAQENR